MNDRRSVRKMRQDDAVKKIADQFSISLVAHPGVKMKRLFVHVDGVNGISGMIVGHDEESLDELINELQAIKDRGIADLPDGPGIGPHEEQDYPSNVVCFPPDRGWD